MTPHQLRLVPLKKDDRYFAACICHQWAMKQTTARKAYKGFDKHVKKAMKKA